MAKADDEYGDVVQYDPNQDQQQQDIPAWQDPNNSSFWKPVQGVQLGQNWTGDYQQETPYQEQAMPDQTAADQNIFDPGWNTFWGMMDQQTQNDTADPYKKAFMPPNGGQDMSAFYQPPKNDYRDAGANAYANPYDSARRQAEELWMQNRNQQQPKPLWWQQQATATVPQPPAYNNQGANYSMTPNDYENAYANALVANSRAAEAAGRLTPMNDQGKRFAPTEYGLNWYKNPDGTLIGYSNYPGVQSYVIPPLKKAPATTSGYKPSNYSGYGGGGGYSPRSSGYGYPYRPYSPYTPGEREVPSWYLAMMNWRR